MRFDDLLVVAWLLIPAVCATLVWRSWLRNRGQWRKSRSAATLVAVIATTANLVTLSALVLMASFAGPINTASHGRLVNLVAGTGVVLCLVSIVTAFAGSGRFRWLIIPAACVQATAWLFAVVASVAY